MKCACGDEIVETDAITVPGGWCAPSETLYEFDIPKMCGDCTARLMFASEFGFDPGKNGENLRVKRGGIKYQ